MAGSGVTLYSTTSAGNKTIIGTIDWRENIYMPSSINDNVAQIMADIRVMVDGLAQGLVEVGDGDGVYTATYSQTNQFAFLGIDVTLYYRVGMRVTVVAPTPGQIAGTITASTFSTHTYVTVAWDAGQLANEPITAVYLGIGSGDPRLSQPTSYRNLLGRNGGLEVWQRGAGGSAAWTVPAGLGAYTADGWYVLSTGNLLYVGQTAGLSPGSRYGMYISRAPGQTSLSAIQTEYPLDTDEIVAARGQSVALSFWAYRQANFSGAGNQISITVAFGTGAPGRITNVAYTGQVNAISASITLTTTPTRYTLAASAAVPANATQGTVYIAYTPTGTAGAADTFLIDDVQLETGTVATPFERRPFEQELAACRRHFWKTFPYETAPAQAAGVTGSWLFLQTVAPVTAMGTPGLLFPTPMRTAPTMTGYNPAVANGQARNVNVNADCSSTTLYPAYNQIYATLQSAAASAIGHQMQLHLTADAGI